MRNESIHLSLSPLVVEWLRDRPVSMSFVAEQILLPHAQTWRAAKDLPTVKKISSDLAARGVPAIRVEGDRIFWLYRDGRIRGQLAVLIQHEGTDYTSVHLESNLFALPPRWTESDEWGLLVEQIEGLLEDAAYTATETAVLAEGEKEEE